MVKKQKNLGFNYNNQGLFLVGWGLIIISTWGPPNYVEKQGYYIMGVGKSLI